MDEDSHRIRVSVGRDVRSAPPLPQHSPDVMRPALAHAQPVIRPLTQETEGKPGPETVVTPNEEAAKEVPDSLDLPDRSQLSDAGKPNRFKRILHGYWQRKLWTLPLTVFVILLAVFAVPVSRYKVLALFIAKPFSVTVTDSVTGTSVTGATVRLGSTSATTDSKGKASLTVPVGDTKLSVSKTYYKAFSKPVLVDFTGNNSLQVKLLATGRQVPVKVVNKITGEPIPEVVLQFGSTNAKTDLNGEATVVLPTASATQHATLTVDGYNDLSADVQVTTQAIAANTFAMVPKGRIFFLSNLSGQLDVVSTNLDGSDRKTVLAGTGSEDRNNTVLLASRDWQYLALLSKRDGGQYAKLYLITTSSGKLDTIDSTAGNVTPIGWNGHYFVYSLSANGLDTWQPGYEVIKSYNADTAKSVTLASAQASGTGPADEHYQSLAYPLFLGSNLIYAATWWGNNSTLGLAGQQNVLLSAKVDGSGTKTLKSVDAGAYYISSVTLADPDDIYFAVDAIGGSPNSNYYRLDSNQNVTQSSTITADTVSQTYPTYLLSPSGNGTFWTSVRDGKNTLFVGDAGGSNGTQIASLSDYAPYGWYTDDYLLVQKNSSELYIMPAGGGTPQKISDYFKPDYAIYGYGGGYGGF